MPQDGACTMLQVSVLPRLMNTHNVISSLTLKAALSPLSHRAAQTDMTWGWVSF